MPTTANSPPLVIETVQASRCEIQVVRDDLLPGGTKQRAAARFVASYVRQGYREFVYASPAAGYARIALARACADLNVGCRVFRCDQSVNLDQATEMACAYVRLHGRNALRVPLGIDLAAFRVILSQELYFQCRRLPPPKRVWVPFGSGTLAKCLRQAFRPEVTILAVDIGVLDRADQRINRVRRLPNTLYARVKRPFSEPAACLPPVPSNPNYDAKLWELIDKHGRPGDLWWNVAP